MAVNVFFSELKPIIETLPRRCLVCQFGWPLDHIDGEPYNKTRNCLLIYRNILLFRKPLIWLLKPQKKTRIRITRKR